jgi:hypothetical protein
MSMEGEEGIKGRCGVIGGGDSSETSREKERASSMAI